MFTIIVMGNSLSNLKLEKAQQPNLFFTTNVVCAPIVNIAKINNTVVYVSVTYYTKTVQFAWSKGSNEPDYFTLANYIENCFSDGSTDVVITSNMFDNEVLYTREKLRLYMNMMFSILMLAENKFL
jgi:hypothetical protein